MCFEFLLFQFELDSTGMICVGTGVVEHPQSKWKNENYYTLSQNSYDLTRLLTVLVWY